MVWLFDVEHSCVFQRMLIILIMLQLIIPRSKSAKKVTGRDSLNNEKHPFEWFLPSPSCVSIFQVFLFSCWDTKPHRTGGVAATLTYLKLTREGQMNVRVWVGFFLLLLFVFLIGFGVFYRFY